MSRDARVVLGALAVALIVVAAAYWAYSRHGGASAASGPLQALERDFASEVTKARAALGRSSSFVGAMGHHAHLVPCAFPVAGQPGTGGAAWNFNRCNYA